MVTSKSHAVNYFIFIFCSEEINYEDEEDSTDDLVLGMVVVVKDEFMFTG